MKSKINGWRARTHAHELHISKLYCILLYLLLLHFYKMHIPGEFGNKVLNL